MKIKSPIIAYEFCSLYIEGEYHKEGDIALSRITFDNLWNFILSSQANDSSDAIMSVHTRHGKRYIKTGRHVGTLQTKDGQTIEILPKIYKTSGKQENDRRVCRKIFLNMLRHFAETNAHSFQHVSLDTVRNFPIMEVYINNYIVAVEELVRTGIRNDYSLVSENRQYLKGKLDISEQIRKNSSDKTRFAVTCSKYINDIPQNRIIVTTLRKLMNETCNTVNKSHIISLLNILSDIPSSKNIGSDLKTALNGNRLFRPYQTLLKWSSQFLTNRGFTTFSGSHVNQSLLFPAERLFEDFIAYLFKRYAPAYAVNPQHTRYFLVDRHRDNGMFRLRPDIFMETEPSKSDYECIIVDTKWKALDETRPDKHYLIDMKDIYQLFAYGQKYKCGQTEKIGRAVEPRLILIYPYSEKFTARLPDFIYEQSRSFTGLKLSVVPFDLTEPSTYGQQIHDIMYNI